ncbi:MAG: hypothetical protein WC846_01680 [Candidatus Gracilibacteria bacterium]|jgi:type II secretory pathway pseudopilin PulG
MNLRRRAESMIESLIAVTIIVFATVAALAMMRSAISGNQLIEDKIVALNLAIEGINAVQNVRDTNYLRYSANADECWLKIYTPDPGDCLATGSKSITSFPAKFYLFREMTETDASGDPANIFAWYIKEVTLPTDVFLTLYKVDFDGNEGELYAQSGLSATNPDFQVIGKNKFSRTLVFNGDPDSGEVKVTVAVTWKEGSSDKVISLTRTIANIY